MDTTQNNVTNDSNPGTHQGDLEKQQTRTEGTDKSTRPTLSEFKKSWGFRRTTIARREFMEEIIDLDPTPLPARRSRSRRAKQTPQTTPETQPPQRTTRSSKSVVEELEWSAPSSPVVIDTETTPEPSTAGTLDPSLWQDFGSAFHTAFSLLGGNECVSTNMPDALAASHSLEISDNTEGPANEDAIDVMKADHVEAPDEVDITQPADIPIIEINGEESDDILVISSREQDSEDLTLMDIKEQLASKGSRRSTRSRGVRGGRAKARGKGRGRGRGRGRSRGKGRRRGRAIELESSTADDDEEEEEEDDDDEVVLVDQAVEPQSPKIEKQSSPERGAATEMSQSHAPLPVTKCIIIDSDLEQTAEGAPGQYDPAPQEKEDDENTAYSSISDSEGYDPNALYCICRQKHNKRFMISCDNCQEWFHGDCVRVTEAQGRKMEKMGEEYICPCCVAKKQNQLQPNVHPQPEPPPSLPECLTPTPPSKDEEEAEKLQPNKEAAVEEKEEESKMQTDSSLPLCIGPGCPKHALPDSVYCGTDCILQHAALTMKSLSTTKEPKSKGRQQRKTPTSKVTTKGQKLVKVSPRSAEQPKEEGEEQRKGYGKQDEATSPSACDPCLTEAQAPSKPSSNISTASDKDSEQAEDKTEPVISLNQSPEEPSTDTSPSSEPVSELSPSVGNDQNKGKESFKSDGALQKQAVDSDQEPSPSAPAATAPPPAAPAGATTTAAAPAVPPPATTTAAAPAVPPPATTTAAATAAPAAAPTAAAETLSVSPSKHHETGALNITKTSLVIPRKQTGHPPSSVSACPSGSQPSSTPTLLSETRNLPVSPAPIAPSSRPSQPNTQVRQSIQRSLTGILYKRVCDCDDLDVSESDVAKLVTNIEMEMFDIFRNTDSKYMNKYRTIMFNLKDPRNKGLLYRVMNGEISPFRLARMSQKDMQATKVPEPTPKETAEAKDIAAKAPCLLQKPEAVKVDLPSLTLSAPASDRNTEQKRVLPPILKPRPVQPSHSSSMADILSCMLKDTTSEHKSHLFDLKCKICTGQVSTEDEEEPSRKKTKVSDSRDKRDYGHSYTNTSESSWRRSAGDDSPLRAPPDSPDMDSLTSSQMEPSSLIIDAPALTIVESPASPVQDSPASPILESPASPVMDSPASPTSDRFTATSQMRSYTPVMIPAVSTVTITRRDPRTAANRSSALSKSTSGPSKLPQNQPAPYVPVQETSSSLPLLPPTSLAPPPVLPKSILMKPLSSADPRLFGASSRTMNSHSPPDGESAQFLAKQDTIWKGFLNMMNVAKFVTKAYLVSGSPESLKVDLPDTIQIGGRIMPHTVWDYVAKLKTSVTKELCVIRFHPATEEEEVAYVSLFSYFSSRGRFGVVSNGNRSIKDIYLVPLSAKEAIPLKLLPLDGPGLEKNRPNILLGLAITQKPKRPGNFLQEVEEKRPKVLMPKDPMWIPKPPVLYGSDKLEIFQPYDPETPTNPTSPPSTGSPSDSTFSGSVNAPSVLASGKSTPPVSASVSVPATSSTSKVPLNKNPPATSSDSNPLHTILKTLFRNQPSDSEVTAPGSSPINTVGGGKLQAPSQAPRPIVDPIVQQYGQKSKAKEIEVEENEYDRPYDPEEEYNPARGYGVAASPSVGKIPADHAAPSTLEEDDVAYDPEDDTFFEDIHNNSSKAKNPPTAQISAPTPCPVSQPVQVHTPISTSAPVQAPTPAQVLQSLPSGAVVVSAATLTEQQRMLEELNKQIEEQKRQLKEQEEALRQQREAVGMFMAHFSVSDSLMSPPPAKALPPPTSQQTDAEQSKPSESADNKKDLTQATSSQSVESKATAELSSTHPRIKSDTSNKESDKTPNFPKENEMFSSAGEIEDSDVAYDPEDETFFNEMQDDRCERGSTKSHDSSLSSVSHGASQKNTPSSSHQARKHRQSPKTRSHRDRDRHGSSPKRSQRRSPSHSRRRKEKDRHRRSERDRSRHRARDQSRHHRDRSSRRHSRGRRRSPSPARKRDSVSSLLRQQKSLSPQLTEESTFSSGLSNNPVDSALEPLVVNDTSSHTATAKNDLDGPQSESVDSKFPAPQKNDLDKESISPVTSNLVPAVKLPKNEQELSLEPKKQSMGDSQATRSDPEVKLSREELILNSKIESTIPLRELEPPIRDSPQSPDPEPQFVKPSSIGNSDLPNVEEDKDPAPDISSSVPNLSGQSNCASDDSLNARANMELPGTDDPNPGMKCQDLKSHVLGQGINETDKLMERKSLRRSEIMDQVVQSSSPCSGSANTGSGQDLRIQGLNMTLLEIKSLGLDVNFLGIQISGANNSGLKQNLSGLETRVPGPYICGQGIVGPRFNMTGIRGPIPDVTGIRGPIPDMKSLGIKAPGLDMTSHILRGTLGDIGGPRFRGPGPAIAGSGIRFPGPDVRGPGMRGLHPAINNSEVQSVTRDPSNVRRNPLLDVPDTKGPGQDMWHQSSGTGGQGPNMSESDLTVSKRGFDINYLQARGSGPDVREPGTEMPYQGQVMKDEGKGSSFQSPQTDCGAINPFWTDKAGKPGVVEKTKSGLNDSGTEMKAVGSDLISQGRGRGRGQSWGVRAHNPEGGFGSHMTHQSPGFKSERHIIEGPGLPNRGRSLDGRTHSPDFKCSDPERKAPSINSLGQDQRDEGPGCPRQSLNVSSLDLRGQSPDRGSERGALGPESGLMSPGRAMRGKDVRGQNRDFRSPGPELSTTGYDTRGQGQGVRETSTDARGQARGCPGQDWRAKEHGRDPGSDERDPQQGRQGLGTNTGDVESGSREAFQDGATRPSSGVTNEKQGPQRDPSPGMRPPGPGHDIRGAGLDPSVTDSDNAKEKSMQEPNVRGPEIRHSELEMRGTQNRVSGPRWQNTGDQVGQRTRGPIPDMRNPDWQGPGPNTRGPDRENAWKGPDYMGRGISEGNQNIVKPGPNMRDPNWRGPHSELRDGSSGPDRRGSSPAMRDPAIPDGPDERSLNMEVQESDRRGPGAPGFKGLGPDRRVLRMKGPGPDGRGPGCPDVEGSGLDRKGPGGPDFRRPGPERQGQHTEFQEANRTGGLDFTGPGPDRRNPGGPDPTGPALARRGPGGPDFMVPGRDRRGPGGPDFMVPGRDRRGPGGPDFMGPGPDRRGPGGPDFMGPGPDRRGPGGPDFMGPGPDSRGPGIPDYTGPGPDSRGQHTEDLGFHRSGGPDFMGPRPDRRGPGGPDFMGPGTDRRRPEVPDYTGPGPVRQGQHTEGPGPHRTGGPDFMGPWSDRRGPGGPDFRGPGPRRRGPDTEGPGPTRRDPLGPNPMESDPDRRGSGMECPGPNRHGPDFMGPGPNRRPVDPDLRGPRPDRGGQRVPNFNCLGPERNRPGGPDFRETGPNRREPEGPDCRGSRPERMAPVIEGPGPYRRGSRGPDFKDSNMKRSLEGPAYHRKGPQEEWGVEDFGGPGPIQEAPDYQGQELHSAGPGNEWNGPDFRTMGPERRGPELRGAGPNMRGGRTIRGPGPERGTPDIEDEWGGNGFRGPGPDRRGPVMDKQWSDRGWPNMEGPESERQGPADEHRRPGFMGPGPVFGSPDMEHPGHSRRGPGDEWRGPDRGCPDPDRWGPGPNFRRERHPHIGEPGPDHGVGGDWQGFDRECQGPDRLGPNVEGPRPDSRGPDFRNPHSNRRSSDMEAPGPDRVCFGSPDYRGPGSSRRGPGGRDEWIGPDRRRPGCERYGPEIENPIQSRRGPEPDFREERRGPEVRGPEPEQDEWRGSDLRGPGQEWRNFNRDGPRPERHGQYMEGGRSDRKDPDMMGPEMDTGGHELNFIEDMQGPGFRGPGSVSRGKGPRLRGRMIGNERKGPGNREPDSKLSDVLTPPHLNNPRMSMHNQNSADFETGQQAGRFHGPDGPHSSISSRPMGPASDMGGQPHLRFDSPHILPKLRPLKHKGPLLPTPTGIIRLPNRIINPHDVHNKNQQKSNSPDSHGGEWDKATSRLASRERDLDREVGCQEQGRPKGGHISTPEEADASLRGNIGKRKRLPRGKQAKNDNSENPQDSKGTI